MRQHHSPEQGKCCIENGDFQYPGSGSTRISRVGMSLVFDCLMIITGFKINLRTPEENKNGIYQYKLNCSKTCSLSHGPHSAQV